MKRILILSLALSANAWAAPKAMTAIPSGIFRGHLTTTQIDGSTHSAGTMTAGRSDNGDLVFDIETDGGMDGTGILHLKFKADGSCIEDRDVPAETLQKGSCVDNTVKLENDLGRTEFRWDGKVLRFRATEKRAGQTAVVSTTGDLQELVGD